NLSDVTLGDIGKGFLRYRPFILTVVAVALITAVLPGKPHSSGSNLASGASRGGTVNAPAGYQQQDQSAPGTTASTAPGDAGTAGSLGTGAVGAGGATTGGRVGGATSTVGGTAQATRLRAASTGDVDPNCDTA